MADGPNSNDAAILMRRLAEATGTDGALDRLAAAAFAVAPGAYSGSVEQARALVAAVFPDARLHVGFDATGLLPYAVLHRGEERWEAAAPTLPLAILRAVGKARFG
jgi:hypothetical protein